MLICTGYPNANQDRVWCTYHQQWHWPGDVDASHATRLFFDALEHAMANQHHPDMLARTYRIHRDMLARMQTTATAQGITEVELVRAAVEQYLPDDESTVPPLAPVDPTELTDATHVKDGEHGTWHEVIQVNATTVTVKTDYSWTDKIPHGRIVEVRTTRTCQRAGCTRAIPDTARADARYCTTRCQVADWRERKRREDETDR